MCIRDRLRRSKKYPIKCISGVDAIKEVNALRERRGNPCNYPLKIIFMGCNMPELVGYETTSRIIEIFNKDNAEFRCPIVACTAYTGMQEIEKCYIHGMVDVIHKPLSLSGISNLLQKMNLLAQIVSFQQNILLCKPYGLTQLFKYTSQHLAHNLRH
eukprot:TRINITY_DN9062_c0_g1_i2.p1 TRINITY_DN9062_c0_g1~~TRINITY_DN9062_c0_g1_i2.p1  ORF type:complete len:176 (-),score=18.12 TRINITY_DN9062_c0_g1_i2:112-582(-)